MTHRAARRDLRRAASRRRARNLAWFFKTGPGEYGEGDVFIGVTVPQIRTVARRYARLSLAEIRPLISSRIHEERLLAAIILVRRFESTDEAGKRSVFRFYMRHLRHINNWDLVDVSAPRIVGGYLGNRSRARLYRLARSPRVWYRRVAILATFMFIHHRDFRDALSIVEIVRDDREDLIHKAAGWALREIGNRDRPTEERFLRRHASKMPRTMLRYAIEKFPAPRRRFYMTRRGA